MNESIRILFLISISFFIFTEVSLGEIKDPDKENLSNFVNFHDKFHHFHDIIGGMSYQGRIHQNYLLEIGAVFNVPWLLTNFVELETEEIISHMYRLHHQVEGLNLTSNFGRLKNQVDLLNRLTMKPHLLSQSVDVNNIETFINEAGKMKTLSHGFSFLNKSMIRVESLGNLYHCLNGSVRNATFYDHCLDGLASGEYLNQLDGIHSRIKGLIIFFRSIDTFWRAYDKIRDLETLAFAASKFPSDFHILDKKLMAANEEIEESAKILKEYKYIPIRGEINKAEIAESFRPREGHIQYFGGILFEQLANSSSFLKNSDKISIALEPMKQIFEELRNVEKLMVPFSDKISPSDNFYYNLDSVNDWLKIEAIPISEDEIIIPIDQCQSTFLKKKVKFSKKKFRELFKIIQHLKFLSNSIGSFMDVSLRSSMKYEIVQKSLEVLKQKAINFKEKTKNQLIVNFMEEIRSWNSNEKDSIVELLEVILFLHKLSVDPEPPEFGTFVERILKIPDNLTILIEAAQKIDTAQFLKTANCLDQANFMVKDLNTILEGARSLKDFEEQTDLLNETVEYLKIAQEMKNAFKRGQEVMKRNLTKETRYVNDLYKTLGFHRQVLRDAYFPLSNIWKSLMNPRFRKDAEKNATAMGLGEKYKVLMRELKSLDEFIGENLKLENFSKILDKISLIEGIPMNSTMFSDVYSWDLDFSKMSIIVKNASRSLNESLKIIDGLSDPVNLPLERYIDRRVPWFEIFFLLFIGLIILFNVLLIIYSLTPHGRRRWKKLYLLKFAPLEDLELYWRYSFWTDQENEKNALCEAVREMNFEHVKALVNKGVYLNVYNIFGNTPLHAAAKYGQVKIVECLIKNGADRNALNFENKTPEQLLGESVQTTTLRLSTVSNNNSTATDEMRKTSLTEKERFSEIEKIFTKYQGKEFRPRVPDLLPTMAFRIRIDNHVSDESYEKFIDVFKGNVTDQMSGVTHFIVPTDQNGIFESNDFGYIMCVFLPTLLMKQQWMSESLEQSLNFREDFKFRVEKVKYNGIVYETVTKWAEWIHKQQLPFLFGIQIYLKNSKMSESEVSQFRQVVEMHGATWSDEIPKKENFNFGSHPYHHFHLGPLFVITDGSINLKHLLKDNMYTVLSFEQFVGFMLKLEVYYDPERKIPIPVSKFDNE